MSIRCEIVEKDGKFYAYYYKEYTPWWSLGRKIRKERRYGVVRNDVIEFFLRLDFDSYEEAYDALCVELHPEPESEVIVTEFYLNGSCGK